MVSCLTGEPTTHTTPKERNGVVHPSYINYHLKSEVSIMLSDAPIIGSLIGSVADMAISTISIIGTNALQTDITTDNSMAKILLFTMRY